MEARAQEREQRRQEILRKKQEQKEAEEKAKIEEEKQRVSFYIPKLIVLPSFISLSQTKLITGARNQT